VVDNEQKLQQFLPTLREASWVAVDTEADSLHAYPEKICLIQVSTVDGDRLIDPLAEMVLDPVLEALSGHQLIMHGADYDLRLLGLRQFGLCHLVQTYLGVKLEKGPQKANWAVRPLTERMERYARNDTHYLKPLSDQLKAELEAKGRLDWHRESCARLITDSGETRPVDTDLVWRLRGSHLLGRPALAVLRELWRWREGEATASNRPPFFVLSHELLVEIAAAAANARPVDPLLPRHLSERRRAGLAKALAYGMAVPPDEYPRILRSVGRKPSEVQRRRFIELQKHRDSRAAELGIDPTLIASRATLSDLAHDWPAHSPELMNWQRNLLLDSISPLQMQNP